MVQTSDGPWFDSGSPDVSFHAVCQSVTYGKAGPWHRVTDALAWVLRLIAAGLWHGLRWGGGSAVGHDGPRTLLWYALRYEVRGLLCGLRHDSNMVCDRQVSCRANHYIRGI